MSKPEKGKTPAEQHQQKKEKKKQQQQPKKDQEHQQKSQDTSKANQLGSAAPEQKLKKQQQPQVGKKEQQAGVGKKQQQNEPKSKKGAQQQQQPSKKSAAQTQPKSELEKKEDVFQAVLMADNFGSSIFGPDSPLVQEGLLRLTNRCLIDFSLESLTSSGVQEIFLCCSAETEELRKHIESSQWATIPQCSIRVIAVEDALSLGDALRDLDAKGFLRNDFILMSAGVVSNVPLRELLVLHREHVQKDKGAVLTLVHRRLLPGHRSRGKANNPVIVVDSGSGKILAYESKPSGKKLHIPLERVGAEMDILMDSVETGIAVCSASVPPLFTDNFDFTSLHDAIREIMINEDILGNSIYLYRLERGYANRVVDWDTFQGISRDILQRWTFPSVPDMRFGAESDSNMYAMHANFVYKSANVKIRSVQAKCVLIGANSVIGKGGIVQYSSIGNNCTVGSDTQITNCQIGDNVTVAAGSRLNECVLSTGTVFNEKVELERILVVDGDRLLISTEFEVDSSDGEEASDDAEVSDAASLSSGPDLDGHHVDEDVQLFNSEVTESLLRGFKERVATENLVLEINSSKFAYNMSFKEVTAGICKAMLSIAPHLTPDWNEKGAKAQWEKTKEVILCLKNVLTNYVKTEESQLDLLEAVEEYANDTPQFRPLLMQTMHLLYDHDTLTEDAILKWHRHSSLYEAGPELRKSVTKLITWLEASDSESEEEDD